MVKTKMSYSKLMEQKHYKSIINLTFKFQGKSGLQHKHYSYALQENSKVIETKSIIDIFGVKGEKLKPLYESGEIIKDCIKPGTTNLSNFLTKLISEDYGYLELTNKGEKQHRKYRISLLPFNKFLREDIITEMNEYPLNRINTIGTPEIINIQVDTPYKSYFHGGVFGLPTMYEKYIKEEDNKQIKQSLINIYQELNKINNIQLKYMEGASHFSFYGKVVIDPEIKEYMDTVEDMVKKMKNLKNGFRG